MGSSAVMHYDQKQLGRKEFNSHDRGGQSSWETGTDAKAMEKCWVALHTLLNLSYST